MAAFNLIDRGVGRVKENIKEMTDIPIPKKKKIKFNFDNLFPRPKGTEKDMGMGNICDGEPFKGVL